MSEEDYEEVNKKLDAILLIMNGNGKLGVCGKVNVMWGLGVFMLMTIVIQAVILTRILMTQ